MSRDGSTPLVGRVAGAIAWRVFVSTAYTTGLTLLIPFVALRVQPAELELVPVATSPVLLWVAIGLMAAALDRAALGDPLAERLAQGAGHADLPPGLHRHSRVASSGASGS